MNDSASQQTTKLLFLVFFLNSVHTEVLKVFFFFFSYQPFLSRQVGDRYLIV